MFSRIRRFFLIIFLIVFSFVLFFEIRFVKFSEIVGASRVAPESPPRDHLRAPQRHPDLLATTTKNQLDRFFTSIFTVKDRPEMLNF